jgi:ketosteroid isomerase-like protein
MADEGSAFARALSGKDRSALLEVLADDVDFRALTPGRAWEASTSAEVADILFGSWFEPQDDIVGLVDVVDGEPVEDTRRVAYRVAVRTPDGDFTVEQQAYYRTEEGRIAHLRVLCSGFRESGGIPDVDE